MSGLGLHTKDSTLCLLEDARCSCSKIRSQIDDATKSVNCSDHFLRDQIGGDWRGRGEMGLGKPNESPSDLYEYITKYRLNS